MDEIPDWCKPECENCGGTFFKKYREVEEVEYLSIEGDTLMIDETDTHVLGDWMFECVKCGRVGADIEDLLATKDEELEDF